jgi:hypothetical protein
VTPILAQITEEVILDLYQRAKADPTVQPWDFIQAGLSKVPWKFYDTYLLEKVRQYLGYNKIELTSADLPAANTRTY